MLKMGEISASALAPGTGQTCHQDCGAGWWDGGCEAEAPKLRVLLKSGEADFEKVKSKFKEWQKQKAKLNHLDKGKFSNCFCHSHII